MRFKKAEDAEYNKHVKFIRKLLDEEIAKKMKGTLAIGSSDLL